jgi:separase
MNSLEALHPRLCSLFNVAPPTSHSPLKLYLLSIPVPPSDSAFDAILLTLSSTYLSYALTIFTHVVLTPSQDIKDVSNKLDTFSQILTTTPSLLSWAPTLSSSLPVKQLDSALTRAYTTLTKTCTGSKLQPTAIFQIRTYAATCLVHTSAATVEPDHFWDQVCRIGGAYIRSRDCSEQEAMSAVLSAYSDLTNRVERRVDCATFMSGKGFVGYCEYWMAFAKKVGRL